MMRPIDYATDLRDILLRRYSWKNSEVEGLVERFRRQPRCYLGLHYPTYGPTYSSWDPYEWAWECEWCGKEAYRLRDRMWIWLSTKGIYH